MMFLFCKPKEALLKLVYITHMVGNLVPTHSMNWLQSYLILNIAVAVDEQNKMMWVMLFLLQ